jgi:hypothetical protein
VAFVARFRESRFLKQTSSLPGYALGNMHTISMTWNLRPATSKPLPGLRTKAVAKAAWVSPLSQWLTARLLCRLLVLSAIAGIICGFLSLLERAQNWPIVNAGVRQLLGA